MMRPRNLIPALVVLLLLLGGVMLIVDSTGNRESITVNANGQDDGGDGGNGSGIDGAGDGGHGPVQIANLAEAPPDPRLSVTEYVTEQMMVDGEPALPRGLAKTGLGLEFANEGDPELPGGGPVFELRSLTLSLQVVQGPRVDPGELALQIYIDADGSGFFDPLFYTVHPEGEGALTDYVDTGTVRKPSQGGGHGAPQPTVLTLALEPLHDVIAIVPPGGSVKLGVVFANFEAPNTRVRVEYADAEGVFQDGNQTPATVPEPVDDPPVNEVELIAAEDCTLNCTPWTLCVLVDLKWTIGDGTTSGGDDHLVNNMKPTCPPDQTTVVFTPSIGCDVVEPGEVSADSVRLALESFAHTSASISAVIEPLIGGQQSETCKDTLVSVTDAKLRRTSDGQEFTNVNADCPGTVFAMRIYPVIPKNAPCVRQLELKLEAEFPGNDPLPRPGLGDAFAYPDDEMPSPPGTPGAPVTRVDPRLVYDQVSPDGARLEGCFQLAMNVLESASVITRAAHADCILPSAAGVCLGGTTGDSGALVFQYRVSPEPTPAETGLPGCIPPTLTVSQFACMPGQAVAGRIAIVREDGFDAVAGMYKPGTGDSNTVTRADGLVDLPDQSADAQAGRDVIGIESGSFVYLRPLPSPNPDGTLPQDEYENLIVFSACSRPIAGLQVNVLQELTFDLCFHFFDTEQRAPGQRSKLVDEFVARANELLAQCCIRVNARSMAAAHGSGGSNHVVIDGSFLTNGRDYDPTLSAHSTGLRAQRGCHDHNWLNVYLVPGQILSASGVTILGGSSSSRRTDSGSRDEPETGTYEPLEHDSTDPNADRFIVISLGLFPDPTPGTNQAALSGDRVACAVTLAHEIGHALGLSKNNMHTSDRQRLMAEGVNEIGTGEEPEGLRFRDPKQQRFNHQHHGADADGNPDNECARIRAAVRGVNANPPTWSFTR